MSKDILALHEKLSERFSDAECELNHSSVFELLVATVLSAQCTDKRVNEITKDLFKLWNTPEQFARLEQEELEKQIFSAGFYRNKAKAIINCSIEIIAKHGGQVPDTLEELEKLPGVGRKTASVVYAVGFSGQAMPVDTHVFRVSHRLGLSDGKNPLEVEKDLRAIIPEHLLTDMHHEFIHLGRYVCKSRSPECDTCNLVDMCDYYGENIKQKIGKNV